MSAVAGRGQDRERYCTASSCGCCDATATRRPALFFLPLPIDSGSSHHRVCTSSPVRHPCDEDISCTVRIVICHAILSKFVLSEVRSKRTSLSCAFQRGSKATESTIIVRRNACALRILFFFRVIMAGPLHTKKGECEGPNWA